MSPLVIIGLLGGIPLALGILLRIHTAALFLSIVSGYLLATYMGDTAGLVSRSFFKDSSTPIVAQLALFFIPIIITMWLMRGSLAPAQLFVHFLPLVGCAILVIVFGLSVLPESVTSTVFAEYPGSLVKQMPDALVGIAVSLQLVLMWITARPRRNVPSRHHRSHKD